MTAVIKLLHECESSGCPVMDTFDVAERYHRATEVWISNPGLLTEISLLHRRVRSATAELVRQGVRHWARGIPRLVEAGDAVQFKVDNGHGQGIVQVFDQQHAEAKIEVIRGAFPQPQIILPQEELAVVPFARPDEGRQRYSDCNSH